MIELTLRIILSLLIVLVLLWGLARLARRPLAGRSGGALGVLARQPLTRAASVQVVRLGDRALVLGVTDQNITLLAEADPADLEPAIRTEVREQLPLDSLSLNRSNGNAGALAGSALSGSTWRQAATAVRRALRP